MIYFDRVSKKFPDGTAALSNVSFVVKKGDFVSVVGPSGAGKTTLLKMILGEMRPSDGAVFFESTDVHKIRRRDVPQYRRQIGMIFQDFRLLPNKTAYENIAFAMEAAGAKAKEIQSYVPDVLDLVGLDEKLWNFPHELSGGEKQRVAIARAIINQPQIVIADEPTGNLDPANTEDIVNMLRRINEIGTTVLLTTHNKGVVDSLGRRVITMKKGEIVRDDPEGSYEL